MVKTKAVSRLSVDNDRRWEHIIESIEEGVVAVDRNGLLLVMNQAAENLTGCSRPSARQQHHSQVFGRNRWISDLLEEVAGSDQGTIRAEGEITGLWGKTIPVRASASPVLDPNGRHTGTVLIFQDLTLQRNLEADVQRAQSLNHLGVLVAGLAHEIKNPLSGIRGAVQLLGTEVRDRERAGEYIHVVLREVDRLTRLLEQLLRLGSRGTFQSTAVNIHRVIEHVLALVEKDAGQYGIRLVRDFDPSLPLVRGDADSLIQVFLNLLQNAIHAVAELRQNSPRQIRVATRMETGFHVGPSREGGRVRARMMAVEVEDSGSGIPAEIQPHVFSPLFTTKPKGTGLGLAISHRIVADHGGTIRFESEPGKTVFRVSLPVWEGAS